MPHISNIESPLLVGGSGRSGTSWVMDVLGARPDVQYVLENSLAYTLYRELNSSWWSEIFRQIDCKSNLSLQRSKTVQLVRDSLCSLFPGDAKHWLLKIIWGVSRTWGVPLDAWVQCFPRARYIHLVREPTKTIMSIQAYLGTYSNATDQASAEHQFLRGHLDMLDLKEMGVPYLMIRLEDITHAPEMVYESLCHFCELEPRPPDLDLLGRASAARSPGPFWRSARPLQWSDLSKETAELGCRLGYAPDCNVSSLTPLPREPIPSMEAVQAMVATLSTENNELKKRLAALSQSPSQ